MSRLLLLALLLTGSARAADAPGFLSGRGSDTSASTLPSTWDSKTNILWKAEIPGTGWSSPVVVGDRVFVTSSVSSDKGLEPRKGLYITDLQGKKVTGEHRWMVHCLDARTGKILWSKTPFQGKATSTIHIKNSLASETPVADARHVWAYFGNVGLACFDHSGKLIWSQKREPVKTRMGWGTGASPALAGDRLILVNDNEEASWIEALDATTGKLLWKVKRDEKSNWGTPFIWKTKNRTEIVTAGTNKARSYDLDGKLLWSLSGMSILSIPTPLAGKELLYVSSGYVLDPIQKPVYAIRPGATGDISLKADETSNKFIVWSQKQAGSYHPTPLLVGDHFYVLYDRGFLACFDAKTGEPVYARKRLGGSATAFTASPWAYNGKVFCLSEDGETVVIDAGKEFKVIGRNALNEMALASPVVANGSLFIRTQKHLWCIRAKSTTQP